MPSPRTPSTHWENTHKASAGRGERGPVRRLERRLAPCRLLRLVRRLLRQTRRLVRWLLQRTQRLVSWLVRLVRRLVLRLASRVVRGLEQGLM